jgi:hypothetical protein
VQYYKIDVKGNAIIIYTSDQNVGEISNIFRGWKPFVDDTKIAEVLRPYIHYSPVLQFILEDEERRMFVVQRYCYRGSIDDWIYVGGRGKLKRLVQQYVKHLDKESFYELF